MQVDLLGPDGLVQNTKVTCHLPCQASIIIYTCSLYKFKLTNTITFKGTHTANVNAYIRANYVRKTKKYNYRLKR